MESSEPSRLDSFLSIDMSSAISFKDQKVLRIQFCCPTTTTPARRQLVPATITTNDLQYRKNKHRNAGSVAVTVCGDYMWYQNRSSSSVCLTGTRESGNWIVRTRDDGRG
jgi:hypothetical protein